MTINGEDQATARGAVLLLAAAPRTSRRRLLDPELGIAEVSTVPTRALLAGWTGAVDVVPLMNPAEPQAVLARIREAASIRGPLLVYLCGQLIRDHRQRLVHFALSDTTDATVRYTALPWAWLARELATRQSGTTAVMVDLVADASCVPLQLEDLPLPTQIRRWGVIAPPARRGTLQPPSYTMALARLLGAASDSQHIADLHPLALAQANLTPGSIVLDAQTAVEPGTDTRPRPAQRAEAVATRSEPPRTFTPVDPAVDRRPAIAEAVRNGNHHIAAQLTTDWEQDILRSAGRESAAMGDVLEVRATAATAAGATVRAAELWVTTAEHRLNWTHPQNPQVQLAVRNALYCWQRLADEEPAVTALGQRLTEVLRTTGRESAATAAEDRVADLQGPAYRPPTGWRA
ncbi:hypothetical protein [Kitasatospora sp. GP82]|uniref:hypothetical protein n=1 Tax=Kitasatospora sp. GP82 TaxID=3035089 RepID=UPI002476AD55|nr:hypothetical protein [Kitasatospora sp. GP82]MDH6128088.1 hypothetical protein [Kitasatospora sp. GP82]